MKEKTKDKKELKETVEYREYISIPDDVNESVAISGEVYARIVEVYKIPLEMLRQDLQRSEMEIRNKDVEHAYVYIEDGTVYHVEGTECMVNTEAVMGKKEEGAIIATHNHPKTTRGIPSMSDIWQAFSLKIKEQRTVGSDKVFVITINNFEDSTLEAMRKIGFMINMRHGEKFGERARTEMKVQEMVKQGLITFSEETLPPVHREGEIQQK